MSNKSLKDIRNIINKNDNSEILYVRKGNTTDSNGVCWRRDRILCIKGSSEVTFANTSFLGRPTNSDHTDSIKKNNSCYKDFTDVELLSDFDTGFSRACFYICDGTDVGFTSEIPSNVYRYFDEDYLSRYASMFTIQYDTSKDVNLKIGINRNKTVHKKVTFTLKPGVVLDDDYEINLKSNVYYKFSIKTIRQKAVVSKGNTNILLNGSILLKNGDTPIEIYLFENRNNFNSYDFLYEGTLIMNITASSVFSGISEDVQSFVNEVAEENYVSYHSWILNGVNTYSDNIETEYEALKPNPYSSEEVSGRKYWLMLKDNAYESAIIKTIDEGISENVNIELNCKGLYTSWFTNNLKFYNQYYAPIVFTMYNQNQFSKDLTVGDSEICEKTDFMFLTDIKCDISVISDDSIIITYKDLKLNIPNSNPLLADVEILDEDYLVSNEVYYGSSIDTLYQVHDSDGYYSFYFDNIKVESSSSYNVRVNLISNRKTCELSLIRDDNGFDFSNYDSYYQWVNKNDEKIETVIVEKGDTIEWISSNNDSQRFDQVYTPISFNSSSSIDEGNKNAYYNFKVHHWYYKNQYNPNDIETEFNFKVTCYNDTIHLAQFQFMQYVPKETGQNWNKLVTTDLTLKMKTLDFREARKYEINVNHFAIAEVRISDYNDGVLPAQTSLPYGNGVIKNYVEGSDQNGTTVNWTYYGPGDTTIWIKPKKQYYAGKNYFAHFSRYFYERGSVTYPDNMREYFIDGRVWFCVPEFSPSYASRFKLEPCSVTIPRKDTGGNNTVNLGGDPLILYVTQEGLETEWYDYYDETRSRLYLNCFVSLENYYPTIPGGTGAMITDPNYYVPKWRLYYSTNFENDAWLKDSSSDVYYQTYKWVYASSGHSPYGTTNIENYWRQTNSSYDFLHTVIWPYANDVERSNRYLKEDYAIHHTPCPMKSKNLNTGEWTASDINGMYMTRDNIAIDYEDFKEQMRTTGVKVSFAFTIAANSSNTYNWNSTSQDLTISSSAQHNMLLRCGEPLYPFIDYSFSASPSKAFFGALRSNDINNGNDLQYYLGTRNTHYNSDFTTVCESLTFIIKKYENS